MLEITISWILFSILFASLIEGKILRRKAKYQGEYDGDYEDYDAVHENYDATNEIEFISIPKFTSTAESKMVNEGETIKLSCIVDKLDNLIIMWKKGSKVISLNNKVFENDDERIKVMKVPNGNELTIRLAEADDAGEYICQVTAVETIELVYNVEIRVNPVIESIPESGFIKVTIGDPVTLSCRVTQGYPTPEVVWRRKDQPLPTGENTLSGLSIEFSTTDRHYSGIYTCTADNGGTETATAETMLTVQHPPEIEKNKLFIKITEENEVEIICIVHAIPIAKVDWFRDGTLLEPKENVITRRGNKHILLLPGIVKDDQRGKYECKAKNDLGEATASTAADPAQFTSSEDGSDMDKYVLEWIVISASEVTECNIKYTTEGDRKDWIFKTAFMKKVDSETYAGKVTLDHLKPGKRYIVQIASKNAHTFSEYGDEFFFGTKEDQIEATSTEEIFSETDYFEEYETDSQPVYETEEGSGMKESKTTNEGILEMLFTTRSDEGSGLNESHRSKGSVMGVQYEIESNEGSGEFLEGSIEEDLVWPSEATNMIDEKIGIEENDVFSGSGEIELPNQEKSISVSKSLIYNPLEGLIFFATLVIVI